MNEWRWALGLVACVSLAGWACSSDSALEPEGNGGAPAEAVGGAGGQSEPAQCEERAACAAEDCYTLAELKAECQPTELIVYPTTCGGTYVEDQQAVTASTWVFDAAGKLVGASFEDEGTCWYWGVECTPIGVGNLLCDADGVNGAGGGGGADAL